MKSSRARAQTAQALSITGTNQDLAGTCSASWEERTESRDPRASFLLAVFSFPMRGASLQPPMLDTHLIALLSNCTNPTELFHPRGRFEEQLPATPSMHPCEPGPEGTLESLSSSSHAGGAHPGQHHLTGSCLHNSALSEWGQAAPLQLQLAIDGQKPQVQKRRIWEISCA